MMLLIQFYSFLSYNAGGPSKTIFVLRSLTSGIGIKQIDTLFIAMLLYMLMHSFKVTMQFSYVVGCVSSISSNMI